jgi:flavorubredoxin
MAETNERKKKTAIVIFDTRYGNTERIARSFERGLQRTDVMTSCVNAKDVDIQSLKEYDLISIGAPTEWLTASKPMKEFLLTLNGGDITGKYGFAFDTKLGRPLSGSAAKLIEKELEHRGVTIILPRESAIVSLEKGSTSGAYLKEGEDKRFEEIGMKVGTALLSTEPKIVHEWVNLARGFLSLW